MFKELASATESLRALLERCGPVNGSEAVHLAGARGRVLSLDVCSPVNLPGFNRAAMDGYAVRAKDMRGATPPRPGLPQDRRGNREGRVRSREGGDAGAAGV
jgi:molybdopterin molybdotransferase